MSQKVQNIILVLLLIILAFFVIAYAIFRNDTKIVEAPNTASSSTQVIYKNVQYGFNFKLPADWKDYSVKVDKWQGNSLSATGTMKTEEGGSISIRSPKWTTTNPTQDIPIYIFTSDQWQRLNNDEFHIGAAPINPSVLGKNSKYVFALPARYNFAYLANYEEVEKILKNLPLSTYDIK